MSEHYTIVNELRYDWLYSVEIYTADGNTQADSLEDLNVKYIVIDCSYMEIVSASFQIITRCNPSNTYRIKLFCVFLAVNAHAASIFIALIRVGHNLVSRRREVVIQIIFVNCNKFKIARIIIRFKSAVEFISHFISGLIRDFKSTIIYLQGMTIDEIRKEIKKINSDYDITLTGFDTNKEAGEPHP